MVTKAEALRNVVAIAGRAARTGFCAPLARAILREGRGSVWRYPFDSGNHNL